MGRHLDIDCPKCRFRYQVLVRFVTSKKTFPILRHEKPLDISEAAFARNAAG